MPFGLPSLPHAVPIPNQFVELKIINLCQNGYFRFSFWEDEPHSCYGQSCRNRFPFSSVQSVQPAQTKTIFFLPSSGIKSVLKL